MYRDASLPDKAERRTDIGPDPGRRPGLMSRTKRLRHERIGSRRVEEVRLILRHQSLLYFMVLHLP